MSAIPAPRQEVFEMEVESGFLPKTADAMAWGVSLGAHLVVVVLLAMIHFDVISTRDAVLDSAMVEEEIQPLQYLFDPTAMDQIGNDSDVKSLTSSQSAATQVGERDPVRDVEEQVDAKFDTPVPISDEIPQPSQADYTAPVETRGATEHPGGVEGAVDRLAWEIANSLREGKTLVVWCFDVSPSLKQRREAIADRVENVYNQLTSLNVDSDKALLSAVVSFSDKHKLVTPEPVSETSQVVEAVRSIESEASGDENVFSAVYASADKWKKYRSSGHRMMIIVVTDERGSDAALGLEKTIAITKKYGIRCYVVGDAAPFGRDKIETPFVLESGEEVIGVTDAGPETYYPDLVRLPYWGINGWDLDQMSSGFGPYALTRLAAETNGLYLITKESGRTRFDPQVMRDYAPDYRPIAMIDKGISKNKAKQALLTVAQMSTVTALPVPVLEFPAENDNVLRVAISDAQKPVADLDYKLQAYQTQLEAGEKDRAKIAEGRWQVAYDLAMGRVLAQRVRCYGYNLMLAEMKVNPKKFEKQGSNRWRLVPSTKVDSGQAVKKMAAKTNEYLNRVIDQHNGTPWQIMAEREKGAPLGWEWKEETYTPPAAGEGGGNGKRGPRFIEVVDPKTGKKVRKQVPDQPVRRNI